MLKRTLSLLIALSFLLVGIAAFAQDDPEEWPAEASPKLQKQVKELKDEVKAINTKLLKARKGQSLSSLMGTKSMQNLKTSFSALSKEIKGAQVTKKGSMKSASSLNLQKLSTAANRGIIIINNFEQRVGVNNRSDALGQLKDLSKVLDELEAGLQ